jgi:hypothetical protein
MLARALLLGERIPQHGHGDPAPGDQEVPEAVGGLVGGAGRHPALPEEDALAPLAADQLERARFPHRRNPLQQVRQRHRGQGSLE